jgi:hypothetical protein
LVVEQQEEQEQEGVDTQASLQEVLHRLPILYLSQELEQGLDLTEVV